MKVEDWFENRRPMLKVEDVGQVTRLHDGVTGVKKGKLVL